MASEFHMHSIFRSMFAPILACQLISILLVPAPAGAASFQEPVAVSPAPGANRCDGRAGAVAPGCRRAAQRHRHGASIRSALAGLWPLSFRDRNVLLR